MDGTACRQKAAVTDVHEAIREDMWQEPAEKLPGVEVGGSWTCTVRLTRGESDGAVLEREDAALGERAPEARGGEVGEGGVSVVIGLTMDGPGDGPDLWGDVPQQSGVAHIFLQERAGDR
jgi:hypothetical protein